MSDNHKTTTGADSAGIVAEFRLRFADVKGRTDSEREPDEERASGNARTPSPSFRRRGSVRARHDQRAVLGPRERKRVRPQRVEVGAHPRRRHAVGSRASWHERQRSRRS